MAQKEDKSGQWGAEARGNKYVEDEVQEERGLNRQYCGTNRQLGQSVQGQGTS